MLGFYKDSDQEIGGIPDLLELMEEITPPNPTNSPLGQRVLG